MPVFDTFCGRMVCTTERRARARGADALVSEAEVRCGDAVCLLGSTVGKQLFGAQDPVGSRIRLGAVSCEVIGVLATQEGWPAEPHA